MSTEALEQKISDLERRLAAVEAATGQIKPKGS